MIFMITIPNEAIEIQKGLWLNKTPVTINGVNYIRHELYSAEGFCFYDNTWPEEERVYWKYMSVGFTDDTANYTSIPVSELPSDAEIA